jgi:hypothetical protein
MFVECGIIDTDVTDIRIFFGTMTGLDTQLDVFISLMNPAFSRR